MRRNEEPTAHLPAIIASLVLALALAVAAIGVALATGHEKVQGDRAVAPATVVRVAPVYRDDRTACRALLTATLVRSVTPAVADADRVALAASLLGAGADGGVRSIGLGSCGNAAVVVVGVADDAVRVPREGPGGTPVLVHLQSGIVAF